MRTWQKKLLYNYFPFIMFIICVLGELVLAVISPIGAYFRGKLLFDIWPATLLAWIIYWSIRWPSCTKQTYFLFVVLICFAFFLVIVSTLLVQVFKVSDGTKAFLSRHLGTVLIGFFLLLAVYQIWVRRHWKDNLKENK